MKRAALTAAVVVLLTLAMPAFANHPVPAGIQAQVTTTTTTVVTTTTTTVGTTTTTTTAPVPTTTPAIIEPPKAILSAESGQVAGELGSWCWPQSNGLGLCRALARIGPPDPAVSLPVTQGETVTLRFETAVPLVDLRVGIWNAGPPEPAIAAPVANPSSFPISLAAGRHVIGVVAFFQGTPPNRVEYEFEVVVRTAARPIVLTG